MTENLYYPLALVVMWMTLVVLSRPTWRNTVLLCVALGFALATRTQAVALGAGIVFAPLVLALLEGSRLVRVRRLASVRAARRRRGDHPRSPARPRSLGERSPRCLRRRR